MNMLEKKNLDEQSPEMVALLLYKKQIEVDSAASWRAEMATARNIAQEALDRAEEKYGAAVFDEGAVVQELKDLKAYLARRLVQNQ